MTDTPRTDSAEPYGPPYSGEECGLIHVPKAFARQLERELNQWKACAEALQNHVQGMHDEHLSVIRECDRMKWGTK